ncbi:hypothetical protein D3C85_1239650 [compost metagenome]
MAVLQAALEFARVLLGVHGLTALRNGRSAPRQPREPAGQDDSRRVKDRLCLLASSMVERDRFHTAGALWPGVKGAQYSGDAEGTEAGGDSQKEPRTPCGRPGLTGLNHPRGQGDGVDQPISLVVNSLARFTPVRTIKVSPTSTEPLSFSSTTSQPLPDPAAL